jgi:type II secretory pathway component PulF
MMGLAIFIIPTFAEVLKDMSDNQGTLPAATQSLVDISNWLTGRSGLNALFVAVVVFGLLNFGLYLRFRQRRPQRPRLLSRLGDRIKWYTPILHGFEKTLGNLRLVQTLRVGLNAGYPVNVILRNALGLDVNSCYRNRIEQWLNRIEAGDPIAASARAGDMDASLAWAFDETVNKGNTPQVLDGLENIYRSTYNYRKNILASASWPLSILGLGLIVGYVVYAMFIGMIGILITTLQYTLPQ